MKRRSFRFKKGGNRDATKDGSESRKTSGKDSSSDARKGGSNSRKSDAGIHKEKNGSREDDRKLERISFFPMLSFKHNENWFVIRFRSTR